MTDRAIAEAVTRPKPIGLTRKEAGVPEGVTVPDVATPPRVRAWVRFPETPVQVTGRAVKWTERAVCVEFEMRDGRTLRTWVWASAVENLAPGQR